MKRCASTLEFLDGGIRCDRASGHEGKHSGRDLSVGRLQHSNYEWGRPVTRGYTRVAPSTRSLVSTDPDKRDLPFLDPRSELSRLLKALSEYQEAVKEWEAAGCPGLPPDPPKEPAKFGHK